MYAGKLNSITSLPFFDISKISKNLEFYWIWKSATEVTILPSEHFCVIL